MDNVLAVNVSQATGDSGQKLDQNGVHAIHGESLHQPGIGLREEKMPKID